MSMTESWDARRCSLRESESWTDAFGDPFGGEAVNQETWSGRMPPQDSDAEQSVLGSMLISKDAIADVNEVIGGADFYRPAHETIYDAVVDLYGRGEPADPVTVSAELQAARRAAARRRGAVPAHAVGERPDRRQRRATTPSIVREKAILRRLVDAGTKIAQLGYAGEGDVDDDRRRRAGRRSTRSARSGRRRTTRRCPRSWSRPSTRSRPSPTTTAPWSACPPASPTSTS